MSEIQLSIEDIKQEKTDETMMEFQTEQFMIDGTQIKNESEEELDLSLPQHEEVASTSLWEATAEEIETLKCRFCLKVVEYRSDFIVHKRKHKPDDATLFQTKVKCDVCLKDLLEKNFRNHFDKNHNKKFPCQFCPLQFDFKVRVFSNCTKQFFYCQLFSEPDSCTHKAAAYRHRFKIPL
jgi:hypothetical protein